MANHLFGVVFGCLLTVASTSNLVYQAVDTRYPAYIINDPRVQCPEDGSFPHPADCSWFYRCVDRSGVGAFHVYFFQCEPGTIFLDEIDQCVFGSKTAPPCVSPGVSVISLPYPLPAPAPPATETAPLPPSPQPTKPPLITFLPTLLPTSLEPSTPPTVTVPTTLPSTPVPPVPETTVMETTITQETSPLAPAPPPTTENTVTVTAEDPDTEQQSTTVCRNCVAVPICKVGLKPFFAEICESCSFANGHFVTPEVECPYHPDPHLTSEGRCLAGTEICPIPRGEQQEKRQEAFTIQCSDFQTRPDDPHIRNLYCNNYHYCSPFGSYLKTQTLCSNYFQCYKSRNGVWSTEMRNCTGKNLYSFEVDQCLPEPKAVELCSRK